MFGFFKWVVIVIGWVEYIVCCVLGFWCVQCIVNVEDFFFWFIVGRDFFDGKCWFDVVGFSDVNLSVKGGDNVNVGCIMIMCFNDVYFIQCRYVDGGV